MADVGKRAFRYKLVDVFTTEQFQGNQLAVFLDGRGLDDGLMQRIALEMNLAETTFVFPASTTDCVAEVRIFTPFKEMVFAGHPTIGTAFVLRQEGYIPRSLFEFRLQEKVGPVPVRIATGEPETIWLRTPPISWEQEFSPELCARVLGLDVEDLMPDLAPQLLSAGNPTLFIPLRSADIVDRASLSEEGMRRLRGERADEFCVFLFAPRAGGAYSRMFAPDYGISEDPATGSATGPLAAYMRQHGLLSGNTFVSEQGTRMGRRSLLHVQLHESGDIDVGGHVTPVGGGSIELGRPR